MAASKWILWMYLKVVGALEWREKRANMLDKSAVVVETQLTVLNLNILITPMQRRLDASRFLNSSAFVGVC